MNAIKKILAVIFVIVCSSACDNCDVCDDCSCKDCSFVEKRQLQIEAEKSGRPLVLQEGMTMNFEEVASSCNMAEVVNIHFFAVISQSNSSGEFQIPVSQFDINALNTGCSLTGNFTGIAYKLGQSIRIDGSVDIISGTGNFEADGGKLQITFIGDVAPDKSQIMNYTLKIEGILERQLQLVD